MATGNVANLNVPASRVWNVCMLAHVDHGKSALSDALISANGIISARSAGKIRYMDFREDEQRRGITMKSSSIALGYRLTDASPLSIVNLIDSPGHVDFSGEVETALRICDGAIIVVDVVEGVCVQTVSVLKAALEHGLQPVLVLNKLDRLFGELGLNAAEAYHHITNILAQVNVIMGVRQVEEMMAAASTADDTDNRCLDQTEEHVSGPTKDTAVSGYFSPELGNVVFASATDGWAFRVIDFARLFSTKFGISESVLNRTLWGDFYFQQKTKRIVKRKRTETKKKGQPMFVQFIMSNIHAIYDTLLSTQHDHELAVEKREYFVSKLGLKVTPRDIKHRDASTALRAIMNSWLPAARCLIETVTDQLPRVAEAQAKNQRLMSLWPHKNKLFAEKGALESDEDTLRRQESYNQQYRAIQTSSSDGPLMAFVVKMIEESTDASGANMNIRVPKRREEIESMKAEQPVGRSHDGPSDKADSPMIAFARILSGTILVGDSVYVYTPRYEPTSDGSYDESSVSMARVTGLYLLMGRGMDPIGSAPAGAVVGIAGLDEVILKTATISSEPPGKCLPAGKLPSTALGMQREAVVRVAVEPDSPEDGEELRKGLRRLNQADPAVETFITTRGEHVIAANGELHLERCLKDLRERFARSIQIHVSKPIVSYRETVCGGISRNVVAPSAEQTKKAEEVPSSVLNMSQSNGASRRNTNGSALGMTVDNGGQSDLGASWRSSIEAGGTRHEYALPSYTYHGRFIKVGNQIFSFRVTAAPLPEPIANALDKASVKFRNSAQGRSTVSSLASEVRKSLEDALAAFAASAEMQEDEAKETTKYWEGTIFPRVWSCGPKQFGTNILVGPYESTSRSSFVKDVFGSSKEGAESRRIARELERSIITGFQMAVGAGPLCEEPLHGVAILVDRIQLPPVSSKTTTLTGQDEAMVKPTNRAVSEPAETGSRGMGNISGVAIGFMREAVRLACMHGNARLMEGMLHVDIAVPEDLLGKTYTVIGQRRGRVLNEEMKEGMNVFGIEAFLPVQDSFGFTETLRKQTSGFAVPQMIFSHWETIETDPFWFPRTEEELEDLGVSDTTAETNNLARKLINTVRRRKGLKVEEKIVQNAEKQRTLSKKK